MTATLLEADPPVAQCWRQLLLPSERHWVVAVSGGADSVYLLFQAAVMASCWPARLVVAHVNYGLRGSAADRDEAHVRALAAGLRLPLVVEDRRWTRPPAGNLQDAARRCRRACLEELAGADGVILLGHQAGDQRESVLATLLKGKSPWAAAGMEARTGRWIRPLITLEPDWIRDRCRRLGLPWREDASNREPDYERNHLRHHILGPLARRGGSEVERLLDEVGREVAAMSRERKQKVMELLDKLDLQPTECGSSLEREAILSYHGAVVRETLRQLGRRLGLWGRDPSTTHLDRAVAALQSGRRGSRIRLGSAWLEIGGPRAWLVMQAVRPFDQELRPGQELRAGVWRVGWGAPPAEVALLWHPAAMGGPSAVRLRRWRAGDRIRQGPDRRPLLADLMGILGYTPAQKGLQLVVEQGGEVVWCPGVARAWPGNAVGNVEPIWMMPCH